MVRTLTLGGNLKEGSLNIKLPNGCIIQVRGEQPGPEAALTLHRWRAIRRFLGGGTVGFGESFMDGDWDSPDLPNMIELAARNLPQRPMAFRSMSPWRVADRVRHILRPNTRGGSRRNIAAHYDLGNEFYALWLDPGMTYSSAVFARGVDDLEIAQAEKNRRLLDLARVKPGDRVIEIGCGWGGFALQAARERNAHVTAITVSEAQFDEARRRVQKAGLNERVDIRLCDYRDLGGEWDHAVSVEMVEAVGQKYWDTYFRRVAASVKPGGNFALQAIVIEDDRYDAYSRSADFIQKHIFPGGALLSPTMLRERLATAGFRWTTVSGHGLDYARTLACWRERFEGEAEKVSVLGFDEKFRRCWSFYLAYCEGGFRAGNIDALQIGLVRT